MHVRHEAPVQRTIRWTRRTALAAAVCLASGCATVSPVKEVNADPQAFLAKHFSLSAANPALVATLKEAGAPAARPYKEARFKLEYHRRALGATEDEVILPDWSFRPLGDGFFQELRRVENNGFLVGHQFALSFLGLLSLKSEAAYARNAMTTLNGETKAVKPFEFTPQAYREGSALRIERDSGPRMGAGAPVSMDCTVKRIADAAEIHPKIGGKALWLDCEETGKNGRLNNSNNVYFYDYGFVLMMGYSSPQNSSHQKVLDFNVQ